MAAQVALSFDDISPDEAVSKLGQIATSMGVPIEQLSNLASAVAVAADAVVGSEAPILEMTARLAGIGKEAGIAAQDLVGISAAMVGVGVKAEEGAGSLQSLLIKMQRAAELGNEDWAKTLGVSVSEFAQKVRTDAVGAMQLLFERLNQIKQSGGSVIPVLDELKLKNSNLIKTVLLGKGSLENFIKVLNDSRNGFSENSRIISETDKRVATFASRLQILKNIWDDLFRKIGKDLQAALSPLVDWLGKLGNYLSGLSDPARQAAVAFAAVTAVIAPLILAVSGLLALLGGSLILQFAAVSAAVATVVASFVYFKDEISSAFETSSNYLTAFVQVFQEKFPKLSGFIEAFVNNTIPFFVHLWDTVKTIFGGIYDFITWSLGKLIDNAQTVANAVSVVIPGAGLALQQLKSVYGGLSGSVSSFSEQIDKKVAAMKKAVPVAKQLAQQNTKTTTTTNDFNSILDRLKTNLSGTNKEVKKSKDIIAELEKKLKETANTASKLDLRKEFQNALKANDFEAAKNIGVKLREEIEQGVLDGLEGSLKAASKQGSATLKQAEILAKQIAKIKAEAEISELAKSYGYSSDLFSSSKGGLFGGFNDYINYIDSFTASINKGSNKFKGNSSYSRQNGQSINILGSSVDTQQIESYVSAFNQVFDLVADITEKGKKFKLGEDGDAFALAEALNKEKYAQDARDVQRIFQKIGEAYLNYYIPGLGTAVDKIMQSLGVGDEVFEFFFPQNPGTTARKRFHKFMDRLISDTNFNLSLSFSPNQDSFDSPRNFFKEIKDEYGNITTLAEQSIAALNIPPEIMHQFEGLGIALGGIIDGFDSDLLGQFGQLLAFNFQNPEGLNELQQILVAAGVSAEELQKRLEEAYLTGDLSAQAFLGSLAASRDLLEDGIPGAVGAFGLAFENIMDKSLIDGRHAMDGFKDLVAEASEKGITNFTDLRNVLSGMFPKEQVDTFFNALNSQGIKTFEDLKNISVEGTANLVNTLQSMGFAFEEVTDGFDSATDAAEVMKESTEQLNRTVNNLTTGIRELSKSINEIPDRVVTVDTQYTNSGGANTNSTNSRTLRSGTNVTVNIDATSADSYAKQQGWGNDFAQKLYKYIDYKTGQG